MDGALEVERNRAAQAVSAKVHTRMHRRVSFGEPEQNTRVGTGAFPMRFGWTSRRTDWFGAGPQRGEIMSIGGVFRTRRGQIGSRRNGQTLVELALLLPLLLLLLVGVTEIGRYAYFDILVSNAARAGAQYGAQSLIQAADSDGIIAAAHNDGLNSMTITPTQQCTCVSGNTPTAAGCGTGACPRPLVYVQVVATDTYSSLFNYPGLPAQMTLTSTVTMRVSQ